MRKLNCQGESFSGQIDKLKGEVRMMFHKVVDPLERLELIDILQRLGISYYFDNEIQVLSRVSLCETFWVRE
jgi:(-)-alpha-terpineol synthase